MMTTLNPDIFTSGTRGKPTFRKSDFYFKLGPHAGIAAEPDPEKHRTVRKWMAPAFSPRALKEQDPVLHKVIDTAVNKLALKGDVPEGLSIPTVSFLFSISKAGPCAATDGEINSGATGSPATWPAAWAMATTIRTSRRRSPRPYSNGSTLSCSGSRWTRPSSASHSSTPSSTSCCPPA